MQKVNLVIFVTFLFEVVTKPIMQCEIYNLWLGTDQKIGKLKVSPVCFAFVLDLYLVILWFF